MADKTEFRYSVGDGIWDRDEFGWEWGCGWGWDRTGVQFEIGHADGFGKEVEDEDEGENRVRARVKDGIGLKDEAGLRLGLGWVGSGCGFGNEVGVRNGANFEVKIGDGDEFEVEARIYETWRRDPETWPHLVWKIPVQPLGLGQCGVRMSLAVAIC